SPARTSTRSPAPTCRISWRCSSGSHWWRPGPISRWCSRAGSSATAADRTTAIGRPCEWSETYADARAEGPRRAQLAQEARRREGHQIALDPDRPRHAAGAEARPGVADGGEQVEPGCGPRRDLELDAAAGRAAHVGDEELCRDRRIRHVQLEVVPVDVEHRRIG